VGWQETRNVMALDIKDKFGRSPIYNADGTMVAMRFLKDQRVLVECGPRKDVHQYVFTMRGNVSMSWVAEADAQCCLNVRGGCCGNNQPGIIVFAIETDIRRWTNGGGP
jgi:hypothetical protein